MTDVKQILENDVKAVRANLEAFKEQTKPKLGEFETVADQLHSLTWEYTSREWKGLRSSFVLRAASAFGGNMDIALDLASLMQLEQDWILPHDDIEDKSELRRGKPALHRMEGVGEDIAINVGDGMAKIADRLFLKPLKMIPEERKWELYEFRNQLLTETTQGQHFEMTMRRQTLSNVSLAAVLLIYDRKTGTYTYELPCGFGLYLSKLDSMDILRRRIAFRGYGAPFQIEDDYLNLRAKPGSGYGKEFADDILEGKWTIFAERAERLLKGQDLERHHQIYGNRRASVEERKEEIELFDKYGVFNEAMAIQAALWAQVRSKAHELVPRTEEGKNFIAVLDYGCDRPK